MSMRVAASVFDLDRLSNENFTGDNTPVAQNPNDLANEYGPCNFDVKHNLTISGVTTTPKFHNTGVNLVAGGWQVSPLISYRTGLPFTVTSGTDVSLSGIGQDRPNPVAGVARYNKNFFPATNTLPHNVQWFNPAAFTKPDRGKLRNHAAVLAARAGFRKCGCRYLEALSDLRALQAGIARRVVQLAKSSQLQQPRQCVEFKRDRRQDHING